MSPENNESPDMQQAREYMSENSLPISFEEDHDEDPDSAESDKVANNTKNSSALVGPNNPNELIGDSPSADIIASNPYMAVVSKLSPSELISKFTTTAHPRVQNAVRTTILGLIGGLPKLAFDTTTITTGQRLASLMFQLQVRFFSPCKL